MLKTNKSDKALVLGILGGGQLAKMLAQSAYRMGINIAIIENHKASPAGIMTQNEFFRGWENKEELDKFIDISDIITLENEFINPEILEYIESKGIPLYPSSKTMRLVQDKYIQKQTFQTAQLSVPDFDKIDSLDDMKKFGDKHGYPFMLKSRKFGYDGYGNATIYNELGGIEAFNKFSKDAKRSSLMAEEFISFSKELAIMVTRSVSGETVVYPCTETVQHNHICNFVIAPAEIDEQVRLLAQELSQKAVESIDGIGVFGVELFYLNNGELMINEIAPRPHNSGHYTIEACYVSQYENCIRAINDLPLGSTSMIKNGAAMVNLLGGKEGNGIPKNIIEVLKHNDVALHLYGKEKCRIGRKMGHITALSDTANTAFLNAKKAADSIVW